MKKFKFKIGAGEYNVEILNIDKNKVNIEVNGTEYNVELQNEVASSKTPIIVRAEPTVEDKEKRIIKSVSKTTNNQVKSPLPGIIVSILIQPGDSITVGQKIITMEAMKMVNSIISEIEGKVKTVKVKVGDTVLQNDVLVEIE